MRPSPPRSEIEAALNSPVFRIPADMDDLRHHSDPSWAVALLVRELLFNATSVDAKCLVVFDVLIGKKCGILACNDGNPFRNHAAISTGGEFYRSGNIHGVHGGGMKGCAWLFDQPGSETGRHSISIASKTKDEGFKAIDFSFQSPNLDTGAGNLTKTESTVLTESNLKDLMGSEYDKYHNYMFYELKQKVDERTINNLARTIDINDDDRVACLLDRANVVPCELVTSKVDSHGEKERFVSVRKPLSAWKDKSSRKKVQSRDYKVKENLPSLGTWKFEELVTVTTGDDVSQEILAEFEINVPIKFASKSKRETGRKGSGKPRQRFNMFEGNSSEISLYENARIILGHIKTGAPEMQRCLTSTMASSKRLLQKVKAELDIRTTSTTKDSGIIDMLWNHIFKDGETINGEARSDIEHASPVIDVRIVLTPKNEQALANDLRYGNLSMLFMHKHEKLLQRIVVEALSQARERENPTYTDFVNTYASLFKIDTGEMEDLSEDEEDVYRSTNRKKLYACYYDNKGRWWRLDETVLTVESRGINEDIVLMDDDALMFDEEISQSSVKGGFTFLYNTPGKRDVPFVLIQFNKDKAKKSCYLTFDDAKGNQYIVDNVKIHVPGGKPKPKPHQGGTRKLIDHTEEEGGETTNGTKENADNGTKKKRKNDELYIILDDTTLYGIFDDGVYSINKKNKLMFTLFRKVSDDLKLRKMRKTFRRELELEVGAAKAKSYRYIHDYEKPRWPCGEPDHDALDYWVDEVIAEPIVQKHRALIVEQMGEAYVEDAERQYDEENDMDGD